MGPFEVSWFIHEDLEQWTETRLYSPISVREDAWSLGDTTSSCSGPGIFSLLFVAKGTIPGQFLVSQQEKKMAMLLWLAVRGPGDLCAWTIPRLSPLWFNTVRVTSCIMTPETAPSVLLATNPGFQWATQSLSLGFLCGDHILKSASEHIRDELGSVTLPETRDLWLLYTLENIWPSSLNIVSLLSSFSLLSLPGTLTRHTLALSLCPPCFLSSLSHHPVLSHCGVFWEIPSSSHSFISSALSDLLFNPHAVF